MEEIKKPVVTIEMEDGGIIKLELYPSKAPETVNNFWNIISIPDNIDQSNVLK